MALTSCSVCSTKVSINATKCPRCTVPLDKPRGYVATEIPHTLIKEIDKKLFNGASVHPKYRSDL